MQINDTIGSVLQRKKSQVLYSVSPDATVYAAIELMAGRNIGAVLVLEDDNLVGILSERDYLRKVVLQGRQSRQTLVSEIMTPRVQCVSPEHGIEEGLRLMTDRRIRHLPVQEGEVIVGMVSIGDLVRWMIEAQSATISQLEGYIVGAYPG